ncbi:MAG: proteasome accessory factor PafA2 family protein [Candidatus Sungbacteria bacterium]|nr:proteasome accessory factor PafA2 family protein [bacterium]MDZ4260374.1 proteasome accessory factor PafA2 family protein [Candidatus Sungbacteria bacterium]
MRVRDRIYGVETEFGAMIQTDGGKFLPATAVDPRHFFWFFDNARDGMYLGYAKGRLWHTNGSMSYMDFNEHPEHATAECRSIRNLVAATKAGELMMVDIFDASYAPMGKDRFILFKNNLAFDDAGDVDSSFGCHENYYRYSDDTVRGETFENLITPFFVTRTIFDGVGWWNRYGKFILSQRALVMKCPDASGMATSNRSFINTKGSVDTGLGYRLHVIGGDSNILETAMYLKVGVTSLVMALIDNGVAPDLKCSYALDALYAVAINGNPHDRCVVTTDGERLSALEVQYRYLEQARKHIPGAEFDSEATREESLHILALWERTLEAIDTNDIAWMIGRIDYVTKKYLFERQCARMLDASQETINEARKNFDLYYHNVTDRTLQERMNVQWRSRRIISDEEISYLKRNPPDNTRARLRGAFVQSARKNKNISEVKIEWNYLSYKRKYEFRREIYLQDPMGDHDDQFPAFFRDMGD